MDVRGKLVELLQNAKAAMKSENLSCDIARNMFVVDFMMANGVTVQEWISAKEPPKERGEYLCYLKYEPESSDVIRQNTYYGSGRWMAEPGRLTHWMPLPEPPKGE